MSFDPIKWIDDAIQKARYGGGVKITWASGMACGAEIENLLLRYGVKCYARQYTDGKGGDYGLTVRKDQARWAEYLLRRSGSVALTSPLCDPSNRNVQPGKMPPEWGAPSQHVGATGLIARALDGKVKPSENTRDKDGGGWGNTPTHKPATATKKTKGPKTRKRRAKATQGRPRRRGSHRGSHRR